MRFTKKIIILAILLVFGGMYFLVPSTSNGLGETSEIVGTTLSVRAETSGGQQSWAEAKHYLPLNVSYQLLAGTPSNQTRYLTVGISSVKRIQGTYLLATLQSIMSKSSPEERASMVVVLLLADFDASWRASTLQDIQTRFTPELREGHLLVLHVTQHFYPPLQDLKRNYNDSPKRVTFRSKQNVDYAFLMNYGARLSHYYLQLEDDVSCSDNFFTHIRRKTEEQEAKRTTWVVIEFSVLGYIGKLYKSMDTLLLARFLFLFYQEMPCDWLMSHFRELLTQKETIIFKPSLFQHMGTFSSFDGNHNHLKDKNFQEHPNPNADVYTDMSAYQEREPRLAWINSDEFFWSYSIKKGNFLIVVFHVPAVLTSIVIETGTEGRDLLQSGEVEIGRDLITTPKGKSCREFQSVGTFKKGRFERTGMDKDFSSASSCLQIRVTAAQHDWLIIRKIQVRTR